MGQGGLAFRKMHGLGNDFVLIDCRDGRPSLSLPEVIRIADRKYGVGCDQVIHIHSPRNPQADIFLDMYNMDGSPLEACGNGTRCAADLWMRENESRACTVETVAGLLACTRAAEGAVRVDMGVPRLGWQDIPLAEERDTLHLGVGCGTLPDPVAVNVGNPHAVFFVPDAMDVDLAGLGPQVERHVLFPQRTNVEFAQILAADKIRVRVWERGTGITQACGSGACAVIVAAVRRGLAAHAAEIVLDGGPLLLEWRAEDDHILMTGPAAAVFDGVYYADAA